MKTCITSSGKTIDSSLDSRFGRCQCFVISDLESGEYTFVLNEAGISGGGAGVSSGQLMVEKMLKQLLQVMSALM